MKFTLEVDLDKVAGDRVTELERILRYWGGNMRHYDFAQSPTAEVSDSDYTVVGRWEIADGARP